MVLLQPFRAQGEYESARALLIQLDLSPELRNDEAGLWLQADHRLRVVGHLGQEPLVQAQLLRPDLGRPAVGVNKGGAVQLLLGWGSGLTDDLQRQLHLAAGHRTPEEIARLQAQ